MPNIRLFLFDLAPGGVFNAMYVTIHAVSSYLAFSPLPNGGILSVALSLGFPARRYLAPFLCRARTFLSYKIAAITQPTKAPLLLHIFIAYERSISALVAFYFVNASALSIKS